MAQFAISITKRVVFRGKTQEFSNTYNYGTAAAMPGASLANDLIDEVTAKEKLFHSTAVTFLLGRCWSSGGTPAENEMISEKALTGTGSTAVSTAMDPERAILIQWAAGLDSRGRAVYLRKWYHCFGAFGSVAMSNAHLQQSTAFTAGERTTMQGLADALSRIGSSVYGLVAASGRQRTGGILSADPPVAYPWLEHHQLGDQWRA